MKKLEKLIENKKAKVAVIGLGYVGLPVAAELAKKGFEVFGIDIKKERVEKVNQGQSYIADVSSKELRMVVDLEKLEAFNRGITPDFKVTLCITSLGIIATIFAALIAVNVSRDILKTYIGILALIMGIILLPRANFKFSWKKTIEIGILAAFNKGLSGGGFGDLDHS